MILDYETIKTVMEWARLEAPLGYDESARKAFQLIPRRRVRLEITAEQLGDTCNTKVTCRVYLAEPRCNWEGSPHVNCECGPLTETSLT